MLNFGVANTQSPTVTAVPGEVSQCPGSVSTISEVLGAPEMHATQATPTAIRI